MLLRLDRRALSARYEHAASHCARSLNVVALALSGLATAIGLFFLGAILWTLLKSGLAGMSVRLFTADDAAARAAAADC